jgi:hypothetical protein
MLHALSRANLATACVAVALFAAMHLTTGRIEVDDGKGWDGAEYAAMLTEGLGQGTRVTELRPLVILLNRPAYWITGDPLRAFELMNFVYAFALALGLLALMDRYAASTWVKVYAIATLFVTIAMSRMPSYYPILIDLGAYTIVTIALLAVLASRRVVAMIACVVAALSREYAVAVAAFGVVRDLRRRTPLRTILGTYAPAFVAWAGIRVIVQYVWEGKGQLRQADWLKNNAHLWNDPFFAGLFVYFLLTVGGGIGILLAADARRAGRFLRTEPEWLAFLVPISLAGAFGGPEMWRYLACLAPALVVLLTVVSRDWSRLERVVFFGAGAVLTMFTQRPFATVTLSSYFVEWFPYYVAQHDVPAVAQVPLMPSWGWRFVTVLLACWALAAVAAPKGRAPYIAGPDLR